jgi:DNA polymerase III alpha subunit
MVLAEKAAGFSAVEADEMRKTLVKKSLDTNDKKAGERVVLREKFVTGSVRSGLSEVDANELFDKIEFFSLYGFSKNHSVPYVIDSYYAAWLHTHHEKEWLATALQSASSNPKELTKTIAEIKSYGYRFSKHDINYSGKEWQYSEEAGAFVPPLGSVKGIGSAAVEEIMANRPYVDVRSMLYDAHGVWSPSKVNKTVLTALCQIEGLASLRDFSDGRVVNHRQLLRALTDDDNYDVLRKGIYGMTPSQLKKREKAGEAVMPMIDFLLESTLDTPDWSRDEKISMFLDLTSSIDADLLFPPDVMDRIRDKDVPPLHDVPAGSEGIGWFCLASAEEKKTKNGKVFYRCKVIDDEFRTAWVRVWGSPKEPLKPYTLWICKSQHDSQWGFSTSTFKLRQLT